MKTLISVLVCVLMTTASARAANIAWVSFHPGDNTPSAAAATAGFTQAPDVGYTQLLAANGHTVTRFVSHDTPTVADATLLNGFDLIIIGRSVASGHYQQPDETLFWNSTITRPIINMGGYTLRNSRLGFTTGATIPDVTSANVSLQALVPSHPIFAGVSLDAGNVMVNSLAAIQTAFGTNVQRGISVNTDPLAAGGTVLARVATAGDPANSGTGMIIGEWAPGGTTATANVLGGPRMVFLSGSREQGFTSEGAGIFDLSPTGQLMFLNAVTYMATVPEPSTYVLLGMGALALLWRWRRS